MPKLSIPATIDEAPAASREMLRTAEVRFGRVPNMALLLSASPAALQGYLALLTSLDGGSLGAQTAERIALAVAETIGCQYGLSLHTFHARNGIGLDDAEITANRSGASNDPRADAAVSFGAKLVRSQGGDDDLRALKAAGYDDGQIIEIVLHAGLNMLAGLLNKVGDTDIDFPLIQPRKAD
jgi:AhpD family alkylhydroperoxidase